MSAAYMRLQLPANGRTSQVVAYKFGRNGFWAGSFGGNPDAAIAAGSGMHVNVANVTFLATSIVAGVLQYIHAGDM